MPTISYAQNREDILLARAFHAAAGFYIDVGAADPVEFSVTKLFSDRGWKGINVEPQRGHFERLVTERPRDVNLDCVLAERAGTRTFYEAPEQPGWSTADPAAAESMRTLGYVLAPRVVQARTLAEVCAEHVRGVIDFLKVDVEGSERAVLAGADFRRWRPRVLLIEATEQGSPRPNHHLWEDLVLAADYRYVTFDGLNRYYVRAEDMGLAEALRVPVNCFDEYLPWELYSQLVRLNRDLSACHERGGRVWAEKDAAQEEVRRLTLELRQLRAALVNHCSQTAARLEALISGARKVLPLLTVPPL